MIRNSILAGLLVFGVAGAASAQQMLPQAGAGNVVGGGVARLIGSGEDSLVQREAGVSGPSQPARVAQFSIVNGETEILYVEPVLPAARGRDARLLGSGDDAQIVYLDAPGMTRRG